MPPESRITRAWKRLVHVSSWVVAKKRWILAALGVLAVIASAVVVGFVFPRLDDVTPDQDQSKDCNYERPAEVPPKLDDEVTTTANPQAGVINFGGARGWQFLDVVVETSQPLPNRVDQQLTLDAPRRLFREGALLTTVATGELQFTAPKLRSPRRIGFTVCVDGTNLPSGRYAGLISVLGPEGFQPLDVNLTVNAKNAKLFGWTLGIALLASFALLALKGASDRRDREMRDHAQQSAAASGKHVRGRDPEILTDPGWWLTTLIALALGTAAGYAVYAQNAAWGDEPLGAVISVAGAVFAPAGLRAALAGR